MYFLSTGLGILHEAITYNEPSKNIYEKIVYYNTSIYLPMLITYSLKYICINPSNSTFKNGTYNNVTVEY